MKNNRLHLASNIDTWVFDLDNTLYPRSCDLFKQVDVQISAYIAKTYGIDDLVEAKKIQKQLYREYGTTLRGLMDLYDVDPYDFIAYAHDIDYSPVPEMPQLKKALQTLEGRKIIFTNADVPHVEKCLARMGIEEQFEGVFDVVASDFVPKPQRPAYDAFCARFDINNETTAMFEDMAVNLEVPRQLGWTTVFVEADGNSLSEKWEHEGGDGAHIDHRTSDLTKFLEQVIADRSKALR